MLTAPRYHTLANHSHPVAHLWNQLDYLGIFLSLWGIGISLTYFEFYSNHKTQLVYCIVVSVKFCWILIETDSISCQISTLTFVCASAIFYPRFQTSAFRPYRVALYASLCCTPALSLLHGTIEQGWKVESQRVSYDWVTLTAFCSVVGIIHYICRVISYSERLSRNMWKC